MKKQSKKLVLILAIILVSVLILSIFGAYFFLSTATISKIYTSSDQVFTVTVFESTQRPFTISPLIIAPSTRTVTRGEIANYLDTQLLSVVCTTVEARFRVTASGYSSSTVTHNIGTPDHSGYFNYLIAVNTANLPQTSSPRTYTIESQWYCNHNILGTVVIGNDGVLGGTTEPNTGTLIVNPGSGGGGGGGGGGGDDDDDDSGGGGLDTHACWINSAGSCYSVEVPANVECSSINYFDSLESCNQQNGGGGGGGDDGNDEPMSQQTILLILGGLALLGFVLMSKKKRGK